MHEHDFVTLFAGYWWLIFPVGWGISTLFHSWQRSRQTEKAMEIIKSYADQGKEPPADIVKMLQPPEGNDSGVVNTRRGRDRGRSLLLVSFIFVALAVAFGVLMQSHAVVQDSDGPAGLLFVTVLMAGFAVAFFIGGLLQIRDAKFKDGA